MAPSFKKFIYNHDNDILLILNGNGKSSYRTEHYKNVVSADLDVNGEIIMLQILETSILLGVPKEKLKNLFDD